MGPDIFAVYRVTTNQSHQTCLFGACIVFFFINAIILLVSIYLRISNVFQIFKINPITIFPFNLVYFHNGRSVEEEPLILPEHLRLPLAFSVTRSLVLCACFSFCTFSFGHCVVCSSSIDGFWLHLPYLQTFLSRLQDHDSRCCYFYFVKWPFWLWRIAAMLVLLVQFPIPLKRR